MLISIIKALSEIWDSVPDLHFAGDELLLQMKTLIQTIDKETISEKDIIKLGKEISLFYVALKSLGVVKNPLSHEENLEVHKNFKNILNATFLLLQECYHENLFYEQYPATRFSETDIINEITEARTEANYRIYNIWKPNKLRIINDYRMKDEV